MVYNSLMYTGIS